jgi:hypothetical protein
MTTTAIGPKRARASAAAALLLALAGLAVLSMDQFSAGAAAALGALGVRLPRRLELELELAAGDDDDDDDDDALDRFACAAFSVCGDPCDANRADTCTEAIDQCNDRVNRIEGPLGSSLAVLPSNPTYRVKDILGANGARWRIDSMTILGEPRYRGTLLRETLIRTATWDRWGNGTQVLLHTLTPMEVENVIQSNSDVEGQQPGTAYLVGYGGGNGITLSQKDANYAAFGSLLTEMYEGGRCTALQKANGEDDQPLIVPFRMGDVSLSDKVAEEWAKMIKEQLAGKKRTVQIRGALHYGNNCLEGFYAWAPEKDARSVKALSYFVEKLQEQDGINVE